MRPSILAAVTILGLSCNAFAEKALILNCTFENEEAEVVRKLKSWANVPAGGVEVADLRAGIAKAQNVLASQDAMHQGDLTALVKSGDISTIINSAKIVRIETLGKDMKSVCAILEGEVYQRQIVK